MTFSNDNIKSLVESIIPFIRRITRLELNDCVKSVDALIVASKNNGIYTVRLSTAIDDSGDFDVINKYGLDVEVGKYVQLYYTGDVINSYIGNINYQSIKSPPVTSVNNKIGDVILTSEDIGAIKNPSDKSYGQLLQYNGEQWQSHSAIVQLWQNENPAQSFDAKTININDLDQYSMLRVQFCASTSAAQMTDSRIVLCDENICFTMHHPTSSYAYKRRFQTYSDRIEFQNGYRDTTAGSTYCIPLAVYGVL